MNAAATIKKIDWWLVFCYFALLIIGWLNIYASIHSDISTSIFDFSNRAGKQFVWILSSIPLILLILFVIDSRIYDVLSLWGYLAMLVLLFVTIFLGKDVKGSHSWLEIGPIAFQPAELSKITTSILLASVMSQFGFRLNRFGSLLKIGAIIIIPMLLIVAEKETGSALVYTGLIFMLYREGLSGWIIVLAGLFIILFILTLTTSPFVSILALAGILTLAYGLFTGKTLKTLLAALPAFVAAAFIPVLFKADFLKDVPLPKPEYVIAGLLGIAALAVLYIFFRKRNVILGTLAGVLIAGMGLVFSVDFIFNNILQDHQRKRIEVLLGIEEDPTGVGYNVTQSMIAIGSGGFSGKGYLKGTQTAFGFVPEQSTDFIFCTVGEEWGFLGSTAVVLLYLCLICRLVYRAEKSNDSYTRIYGYCAASCFFMHFFINIGMTIGLMPVIGIPLPFMSYGGSSMWCFTIMLFIFIALDIRQKR